MIKLNTNENPFPPSDKVLKAMKKAASADMRLYPDPEATELREVFAKYAKVEPENVFVGNGSDEVLAFTFETFFEKGKTILFPDICYSFYPVYCKLFDIDYETVPLKADFTVGVKDYVRDNGGIVITNPNAPTGIALAKKEIEYILKRTGIPSSSSTKPMCGLAPKAPCP